MEAAATKRRATGYDTGDERRIRMAYASWITSMSCLEHDDQNQKDEDEECNHDRRT